MNHPVDASCHCGAVRLTLQNPPDNVTECNCTICRRYGALWAYYVPDEVTIRVNAGSTEAYVWGDRSIEFHRCDQCGCITHWSPVDRKAQRMAVNARLLDPVILRSLRIRKLDGADTFRYLR
jgi:hypothetical protein